EEFVMAGLDRTFGIAVPNFTAYPQMPDVKALVEYGVRMEHLGFDSLWVWDHILLGVEPNFPIIESLTLLTAIAARTNKIKLGTGILVLPMRNPVILAKQLACMDLLSDGRLLMGMASGWYRREFNAIGVPFEQRGKIMDESLDILKRFWTEHTVSGKFSRYDIPAGVMVPKAAEEPIPADPDRRICRSRPQARSRQRRRLADLFLSPRELRQVMEQDPRLRKGRRKGPGQAAQRRAAADLHRQVPPSRRERNDGMAQQGMGFCRLERIDQG